MEVCNWHAHLFTYCRASAHSFPRNRLTSLWSCSCADGTELSKPNLVKMRSVNGSVFLFALVGVIECKQTNLRSLLILTQTLSNTHTHGKLLTRKSASKYTLGDAEDVWLALLSWLTSHHCNHSPPSPPGLQLAAAAVTSKPETSVALRLSLSRLVLVAPSRWA